MSNDVRELFEPFLHDFFADKLEDVKRRLDAFHAINTERNYQQIRWGDSSYRQADDRMIDEYALYIARYTARLVEVATTAENDTDKLDVVRKIAALCVACMERHGAPVRKVT